LKNSPVIIKREDGLVDVLPIEDMFRTDKHKYEGLMDEYINADVWNGKEWTMILKGTSYHAPHKRVKLIQTRKACYEATFEHIAFDGQNKEVRTINLNPGDKLYSVNFPEASNRLFSIDTELSALMGYIVGDGYINGHGMIRLTGVDKEELLRVSLPIINRFGWKYSLNNKGVGQYDGCVNDIWALEIHSDSEYGIWLRKQIYTYRSNEKRVPMSVLNADIETKRAFFDAYYLADGRKAGHESYQYKGFTTKSAALCLGLIYLLKELSPKQLAKVKCEYRDIRRYYYVQLTKDNDRPFGDNLIKEKDEIINIFDTDTQGGWFYDLQTESQTFATGANLVKLHNSPRRGRTFVTQKIVHAAVRIKLGLQDSVSLGNLEAYRDWGHAKDYARAQMMIINHTEPDDFVVATGFKHNVREFAEVVFNKLGMDFHNYCKYDPQYLRPNEVPALCGDSTKLRNTFGWKPEYSFSGLVEDMIEAALREERHENNRA
jgi:GDPmannose 4,6-dehydratase